MKNSFLLYTDYKKHIDLLPLEEKGKLLDAIFNYAEGIEVELDGMALMAFSFIKAQMDRDVEKYEEKCEKRKAAGAKGGIAKASKNKQNLANVANATNAKQSLANVADTDTDNENDTDNDINNPHTPLEGEQEPKKKSVTSLIAERNFSKRIQEAVEDWVKYKIEKRQGYKETGLKSFLTQVENNTIAYGEDAVISVIQSSMSSNYQGVVWDKLRQRPPTKTTDWSSIA